MATAYLLRESASPKITFVVGTHFFSRNRGWIMLTTNKLISFAIASTLALGVTSISSTYAGDGKLPEMFVSVSEYFVGDWASEVEVDGNVYRGTWTVDWSPEKACLVSYYKADSPDGPVAGTRVQGWDTSTEEMLVVEFSKSGSSSVERYKLGSNKIDEGKITAVDADGTSKKATARTDRTKRDSFTWTVTTDGQAQEYKFRRMK
jgi:hypothetical protein